VTSTVEQLGLGGAYAFYIDYGQTEHTISQTTLDEVVLPEIGGHDAVP
jgi:hypothetical protein